MRPRKHCIQRHFRASKIALTKTRLLKHDLHFHGRKAPKIHQKISHRIHLESCSAKISLGFLQKVFVDRCCMDKRTLMLSPPNHLKRIVFVTSSSSLTLRMANPICNATTSSRLLCYEHGVTSGSCCHVVVPKESLLDVRPQSNEQVSAIQSVEASEPYAAHGCHHIRIPIWLYLLGSMLVYIYLENQGMHFWL